MDIEKLKKRAHLLYRSLITKVATRDVSIEQHRGDLHELKALYRGVTEAANVREDCLNGTLEVARSTRITAHYGGALACCNKRTQRDCRDRGGSNN